MGMFGLIQLTLNQNVICPFSAGNLALPPALCHTCPALLWMQGQPHSLLRKLPLSSHLSKVYIRTWKASPLERLEERRDSKTERLSNRYRRMWQTGTRSRASRNVEDGASYSHIGRTQAEFQAGVKGQMK